VRRKVDFALAGHRARHHDSRGDRFGRKGDRRDKPGRRDKRGRRDEKPDRARQERPHGASRPEGRQDKRRANVPSAGKPGGNRRRAKPKKRR
jgi:hypothetical protein